MPDSRSLTDLTAAYRAWHESKGADRDCWLNLMGDEVSIHSMGGDGAGLDFAKDCHSKAEAVDFMATIPKDWQMIHWTPNVFVEDGDRIAMFGRCGWTCRKTVRDAEVDIAHLWRFADGKIVDLIEIFDSARVVAAATEAD